MPKISVIMPVLRMDGLFRQAVGSILRQTWRDWELIVVAEKSGAGGFEAELSMFQDKRVKFCLNPSRPGISASLNHGIRQAEGQYLARMDADDLCRPDRLEIQARWLDAHRQTGLLGSAVRLMDESGRRLFGAPLYPGDSERIRSDLLFYSPIHHPTVMIRREFLEKAGLGYDETLEAAEDYGLWSRAACFFPLANIPEPLLYYRRHASAGRAREQLCRERHLDVMGRNFSDLGLNFTREELRLLCPFTAAVTFENKGEARRQLEGLTGRVEAAALRTGRYDRKALAATLSARLFYRRKPLRGQAAMTLRRAAAATGFANLPVAATYLEMHGFLKTAALSVSSLYSSLRDAIRPASAGPRPGRRVLHILDSLRFASGLNSVVLNLARHMDEERFDFMVFEEPEAALRSELSARGSRIVVMPPLQYGALPSLLWRLLKFFQKNRGEYRVIHLHLPNMALFCLGPARVFGLPARLVHSHSPISADKPGKRFRNNILIRAGVAQATHLLACSDEAAGLFGGRRAVNIIHNGIDIARYAFSEEAGRQARLELGLAPDEPLLGSVGRLSPAKNMPFLIDVFASLRLKEPKGKLLIVGDGPERARLEQKIRMAGLEGRVILAGSRRDVPRLLQALDIYLAPSLFEGFYLAGLEAQAAGLPCLFSDQIPRLIRCSDRTQYLSLSPGPELWAEKALEELRSGRNRAPGKETARFDAAGQARLMADFYKGLPG